MKSGVWLLDKPAGLTSAQALAAVKRKWRVEKIGHAGTLDPMATGLLVCLVNSATRLAPYAAAGGKTYAGTIDFGLTTSSDDIEGEVLSRSSARPDLESIRLAAEKYQGRILQVPPQVSAVKVDGKRAYKTAREGGTVDLAPREVEISALEIEPVSQSRVFFRLECSKGTYVRALARDLGADLGCGACLSSLRREKSEPFSIRQARRSEDLSWEDLLDWRMLFPTLQVLGFNAHESARLKRGDQTVLMSAVSAAGGSHAIYVNDDTGQAQGLLVREDAGWRVAVNLA